MSPRRVRIDPHSVDARPFEGWGTSLAWWAKAVGMWPARQRAAVVRRLFTLGEGGLGLRVLRFNAGGGENPAVEMTMEPRAVMDGYRHGPGEPLDRSADRGQRAVLRDAADAIALEGGAAIVEVFGNSPPWWATLSGSVTGATRNGRPAPNLDPVRARDYLRYLADVADFIESDSGVAVSSVSPFNEPTSEWWMLGGRQEGCNFTQDGIDRLLTEASVMGAQAFGGRAIAASEEWSLTQALATWDALGATARRTVGRVNAHSYDGDARTALRALAMRAGLDVWVSEYGDGEHSGHDMALAIVRDLRELAPRAWVLWQAVSGDAWGLLRFGPERSVRATPKLEVLARFTRAIRPGMRLVGSDDPHSVAALGDGRVAVVLVSARPPGGGEAAEDVEVDLSSFAVEDGVSVEVALAGSLGRPSRHAAEPDADGIVRLRLPAGGVASLTAAAEPAGDAGAFLGSGTWWLEHALSGLRLDLDAAGDDLLGAGARVRGTGRDDRSISQRWRAESCGDGAVRWVCEASGHELDVQRASTRAGAHVIQWQAGEATRAPANARFDVCEVGGEAVELRARHSGRVVALDAEGLGVQRPPGEPGTRWRLRRADAL